MTRTALLIFLFGYTFGFGQTITDNFKITVYNYTIVPFYVFTNKPAGTFIPGDEKVVIPFPSRTDTVIYFNEDGRSRKDTSTTTHFTIDRIIDTICVNRIDNFVNEEITVEEAGKKLKIDRIAVKVLFPDGTFYNTNFNSNKISFDSSTVNAIKKNIDGSFIVLHSIWFFDLKGKRQEISDDIGWKIKNCH